MPHFAPVRVRGGRSALHRLLAHRRRALAAGLAVTAAALVAAGPHPGAGGQDPRRARGHPVADPVGERHGTRLVAAPVRIADAGTVRLLSRATGSTSWRPAAVRAGPPCSRAACG
ncbi:hypothetical protein SVIOM342S_02271 [Streptomyces violaceorubidus]